VIKLASLWRGREILTVKMVSRDVQVLAVIPDRLRPALLKQLAPLKVTVVCVDRGLEIARRINEGAAFEVALLPASYSRPEWWALWGELCLIDPRPEILVYAEANTFQLWTGVLDMGGFDVIVEPFSALEIQGAVLRAIQSFKRKARSYSPQ
jgi:DNA-binding NtrC family response regulator